MNRVIFSLLIGVMNCLPTIKHNAQINYLLLSMIYSFYIPVIAYNIILDYIEENAFKEYSKGILRTIISL